jgi:hypothetical protein
LSAPRILVVSPFVAAQFRPKTVPSQQAPFMFQTRALLR